MSGIITNPVEALVEVAKENSDLHEEQSRTWAELDLYRNALTQITGITSEPYSARIALAALAQRRTMS